MQWSNSPPHPEKSSSSEGSCTAGGSVSRTVACKSSVVQPRGPFTRLVRSAIYSIVANCIVARFSLLLRCISARLVFVFSEFARSSCSFLQLSSKRNRFNNGFSDRTYSETSEGFPTTDEIFKRKHATRRVEADQQWMQLSAR